MASYKFQVGDKVFYWPKSASGVVIAIDKNAVLRYAGDRYTISWNDRIANWPVSEIYLRLIQNGMDKLDDIL